MNNCQGKHPRHLCCLTYEPSTWAELTLQAITANHLQVFNTIKTTGRQSARVINCETDAVNALTSRLPREMVKRQRWRKQIIKFQKIPIYFCGWLAAGDELSLPRDRINAPTFPAKHRMTTGWAERMKNKMPICILSPVKCLPWVLSVSTSPSLWCLTSSH